MPEDIRQDLPDPAAPEGAPAEPCGGCPGCPHQAGATEPETSGPSETPEPAGEPVAAPADDPASPPAPPVRERKPRLGWVATAHLGKMSRLEYLSAPTERGFEPGRKVIVRTDRGTEMGTIVFGPRELDMNQLPRETLAIVRAATAEDLAHQKRIEEELEPAEFDDCQKTIALHRLPMKLAEVEHVFGGEKLTFYFMADGRVDFRALVREMARKHRARIDFRQIGVRDEARLLAEYEHCGRPLCCRQFLRGLEPVTMRMAKLQKATLDPAKISGRCGRLMCCLRYEDETYAYLRSKLPGRGAYVLTEDTAGQVLSSEVISQKVTVGTHDGRRVVVAVKDIKQVSDKPIPPPERKLTIPEPAPGRPPMPRQTGAGSQPRPGGGDPRRSRQGSPQRQGGGHSGGQRGQQRPQPSQVAGSAQEQGGSPVQGSAQGQRSGGQQPSGQGQGRNRRRGNRHRRGGSGRGPGQGQGQRPGPGQQRGQPQGGPGGGGSGQSAPGGASGGGGGGNAPQA